MFLESNYARRLQSAKYTREKVVESRSAILEVDGAPSSTVILVQYWTNIEPIWNIAHMSAKM